MRNSLKLSALDAVIMLAMIASMFIIDATNLSGISRMAILCFVGAACVYILIRLIKKSG
jgi:hypothetical protein